MDLVTAYGVLSVSAMLVFYWREPQALPDPSEQQTVVSQVTALLVGEGTPYHYLVQVSTALLLVLAANTAFADFPRLSSILARDGFMPRQFGYRGDRLAFSIGIIVLSVLSAFLIVAFAGSVTNLIPLYTIGVFVAFTLSQTGMVRHWWKLRNDEPGWQVRATFNGVGAVATGIVAVVVGVAKFALGAWMVLVLIPILIAIMWGIHRHYRFVRDALTLERPGHAASEAAPAGRRPGEQARPGRPLRARVRPLDLARRDRRACQRQRGRSAADAATLGALGRPCPAGGDRVALPGAHPRAAGVPRRAR